MPRFPEALEGNRVHPEAAGDFHGKNAAAGAPDREAYRPSFGSGGENETHGTPVGGAQGGLGDRVLEAGLSRISRAQSGSGARNDVLGADVSLQFIRPIGKHW